MEFIIKDMKESTNSLMRRLGYRPAYFQPGAASFGGEPRPVPGRETSIVRPLGGKDYPRFHLYITQKGADMNFSLHLDQKKPSYEGSTAHSGDYDGEAVEGEAERIKQLLNA